jgi:isoquinoline 1-oxidoreductase alpha subunit
MPFKLNVNGQSTDVDVPSDMPWLWVIRDVLNLRGTKFGCGAGLCGPCRVHLNGRAVRSCQTPVLVAAKAQIITLEGLSPNGTHAVQLAWQELDVPQCGYCQAGQMRTASALLVHSPSKDLPEPKPRKVFTTESTDITELGRDIQFHEKLRTGAP